MDLFEKKKGKLPDKSAPLADRMRPSTLDEFVGQIPLIGQGSVLRKAVLEDKVPSMILWGPPGSGKTTLAHVIAQTSNANFVFFSAVTSGVKEVKAVIEKARKDKEFYHKRTILFVDELHRFNKAQQDAFLPHVEAGIITLIGATTENPSFEVVSPLLSRCKVYVLYQLTAEEIKIILQHALENKEKGLGNLNVDIEEKALDYIAQMSNGDARIALNTLEMAALTSPADKSGKRKVDLKQIEEVMLKKALVYDKAGEEHYNVISAFIKSLRGSDPDAALYWMFRMLEAGEDPIYIARRMVVLASEDIGNADPQALQVAVAAKQAVEFIGLPEGEFALSQAAVYLATAPKSNAIYQAMNQVKEDIKKTLNLPVPLHLRNAPTPLMEKLGYARGYKYPHQFEGHFVTENYLPEQLKERKYYSPTEQGFETEIEKRMEKWKNIKEQSQSKGGKKNNKR
jgi:putative ATPase